MYYKMFLLTSLSRWYNFFWIEQFETLYLLHLCFNIRAIQKMRLWYYLIISKVLYVLESRFIFGVCFFIVYLRMSGCISVAPLEDYTERSASSIPRRKDCIRCHKESGGGNNLQILEPFQIWRLLSRPLHIHNWRQGDIYFKIWKVQPKFSTHCLQDVSFLDRVWDFTGFNQRGYVNLCRGIIPLLMQA